MRGQHSTDIVNKVMDDEVSDRVPIPLPGKAKERLGFEDNVAWLRDDTKSSWSSQRRRWFHESPRRD